MEALIEVVAGGWVEVCGRVAACRVVSCCGEREGAGAGA